MKKLIFFLLFVSPVFVHAQTAKIQVDIDRQIGDVDPNIYGAFIYANNC